LRWDVIHRRSQCRGRWLLVSLVSLFWYEQAEPEMAQTSDDDRP
jgi:hypothetical protein